ncbi:hypothetical protein QLX67_07240 [Balneolaceae bacterium ANBcel3]|nr:hypothetical protein [Balneolaceae bacterium ANBcel3]
MSVTKRFILTALFGFLWAVSACSDGEEDQPWTKTIPAESPLVFVHHNTDFQQLISDPDVAALQEIATFRMDGLSDILSGVNQLAEIKATALFPALPTTLEPLFILKDPGTGIQPIARNFEKPFAENSYRFDRHTIYRLHLEQQTFFSAQAGPWILLSKNSSAIEKGIENYYSDTSLFNFSERELSQSNLIVNTPSLENWIALLGAPRYHPRFQNILSGTGPAALSFNNEYEDDPQFLWSIQGLVPFDHSNASAFVETLASSPQSQTLERYVPEDAALLHIFHSPSPALPSSGLESIGPLDSVLTANQSLYRDISQTFSDETAFVAFEASGFLSTGEHMFIRRMAQPDRFEQLMSELADQELIEKQNDLFFANSTQLAYLFGDPTGRFSDFYFIRSGESVIVTRRAGLARRVTQDRRRRAVLYYDDEYLNIKARHPQELSSWLYVKSPALLNYLDPYLHPLNHASFLMGYSEILTVSLIHEATDFRLQADSYTLQDRTEPIRDLWTYSIGQGQALTGEPRITNALGGARKEIFVATTRNNVFGIASDGTGFLEVSTANDRPVGSPIIYDWYGNNQYAVLQAAGNKIYGWNMRGIPLPNFPIVLEEEITAPVTVADVVRNGQPELIVATADRKLHVLNQRGNNVSGWPQEVNVPIRNQPLFHTIHNDRSVWVTAGNALFAFSPYGERREHYPVFIESEFGEITFHNNHILAGASDGHLYAIGREPFFQDSLVVSDDPVTDLSEDNDLQEDESSRYPSDLYVRKIYVGNSPITKAPLLQNARVPDQTGTLRQEPIIALQNLNGNLFLFNHDGALRMSKNMGQSSSRNSRPIITDINGNGSPELISTSSAGRLFAWNIASGERIEPLPTASMHFPVFMDILVNGDLELVAQTRDGVRCWSFRKQ